MTREELQAVGLGGLVGTNMLKAYMHGFFVDSQLYFPSPFLKITREEISEMVGEESWFWQMDLTASPRASSDLPGRDASRRHTPGANHQQLETYLNRVFDLW